MLRGAGGDGDVNVSRSVEKKGACTEFQKWGKNAQCGEGSASLLGNMCDSRTRNNSGMIKRMLNLKFGYARKKPCEK